MRHPRGRFSVCDWVQVHATRPALPRAKRPGRNNAVVEVNGTFSRSNSCRTAGSSGASKRVGLSLEFQMQIPDRPPQFQRLLRARLRATPRSLAPEVAVPHTARSLTRNTTSPSLSRFASSKPNSVPSSATPRQMRFAKVIRSTGTAISRRVGSAATTGGLNNVEHSEVRCPQQSACPLFLFDTDSIRPQHRSISYIFSRCHRGTDRCVRLLATPAERSAPAMASDRHKPTCQPRG